MRRDSLLLLILMGAAAVVTFYINYDFYSRAFRNQLSALQAKHGLQPVALIHNTHNNINKDKDKDKDKSKKGKEYFDMMNIEDKKENTKNENKEESSMDFTSQNDYEDPAERVDNPSRTKPQWTFDNGTYIHLPFYILFIYW